MRNSHYLFLVLLVLVAGSSNASKTNALTFATQTIHNISTNMAHTAVKSESANLARI